MRSAILAILLLGGCLSMPAQTVPATVKHAPAITQQALEQRIAALKTQYDQAIANANALQGAIQDCQYWLDQFKATDEAKAKKDYDKDHPAPQPKP